MYALDELLRIIATPCFTTLDERTQASCVFLFLSGMRVSAFITMPIKALDLEARTVKQWPSLGMHTKLGIKATTKLLNIPELLEIVKKWGEKVRGILPPDGLWYAPLSPITEEIYPLCGGTVPQASVSRNGKPDQATINWVLTPLMKEQSGAL